MADRHVSIPKPGRVRMVAEIRNLLQGQWVERCNQGRKASNADGRGGPCDMARAQG